MKSASQNPKLVRTSQGPIVNFSCGYNHTAAVDTRGNMICWGQNFERQLGLYNKTSTALDGPRKAFCKNTMVEEMLMAPRLIPFATDVPIYKVSCGDRYTIVLTKKGDMFSWGAGECGQLGTGRVTQRETPLQITVDSEQVMLATQQISSATSSADISGGPETTNSKNNKKTTDKKVNSRIIWKNVACGSGHVIAITSTQQLYAWGFNKRGQLGLGDTDTRFAPTLISQFYIPENGKNNEILESSSVDESNIAAAGSGGVENRESSTSLEKNASQASLQSFSLESASDTVVPPPPQPIMCNGLYASENSSAMVLSNGNLYTWGSGSDYRLQHLASDDTSGTEHTMTITKVALHPSERVTSFAFSKFASAYVVPTRLDRITPEVGPQKSMKRLELHGTGYWDSEDIVVKFTSVGNPFIPPRSCMGTFQEDGIIVCKPPRLAEAGEYSVSLSLNGLDFCPETKIISMYPDPTINQVKPKLVDIRSLVDMPKGAPKNAKRKGLEIVISGTNFEPLNADEKPDLIVRFNNTTDDEKRYVEAPGKLIDLPKEIKKSASVDNDLGEESGVDSEISRPKNIERTIKCVVLKQDLMDTGRLLVMTTQVSLNGGTDYSVDSDDTLILHSFELQSGT